MDFTNKTWSEKDFENLYTYLESYKQGDYKKFSSSLIPNCENILGVKIPVLRNIAKQIAKGNWRAFADGIGERYLESVLLHGFVLGYAKCSFDEMLEHVRRFVPKVDNWESCDCCCSGFKFVKEDRESTMDFLKELLASDREFDVRFAVVMLMDYYIDDKYIDTVLKLIENVNHDGYYVKTAAAWALSVCFIKYRDRTLSVLSSGRLDAETQNKTVQKIRESKRVSDGDKKFVNSFKIQA